MRIKSSLIDSMTIFRYSLLVTFAILSNPIFSQITAPNASFRALTNYTVTPNDSLYVFCDYTDSNVGSLEVRPVGGTSGWTFTWTKWDSVAKSFTISLISTETTEASVLSNLTDGRYRVEATNGIDLFDDIAWVLNNTNTHPSISKTLDCVGVNIRSYFTPNNLQYINVDSKTNTNVLSENDIIFWLQRDADDKFMKATYAGNEVSFFDLDAFEGELSYSVRVVDQYNCEYVSDPISTSTYVVKAEFFVDPMTGEAPLEVEFRNESVNADDFEWFLYQDFDRIADVTTVESNLLVDGIITDKDPVAYTYLHPGNYYVKLIASSDKGPETCIDEFYLKTEGTPIVVDTSLVQVPNVFTPNGDGRNDIFRVKSQSLKSFSATIFNRWGKVIYEWRDPDGGWNGKLNGKWATPGTYFYVITATGREEQKKKYTKKGSFMLIRK